MKNPFRDLSDKDLDGIANPPKQDTAARQAEADRQAAEARAEQNRRGGAR